MPKRRPRSQTSPVSGTQVESTPPVLAVPSVDEASSPTSRDERDQPASAFLVVGIGASAGGLDALKGFLGALPPQPGMAFVLVPHLDPTHPSLMVEILSRRTALPIREVQEGMAVEADHVYVIPPGRGMEIHDGRFHLTLPGDLPGRLLALDHFFQSLARDQWEMSVGVVLSGTGSHGTSGLKEIKLAGGLVMVQRPETAEFAQMPQSAIEAGLADFVLPPQEMPAALLGYARNPYLHRSASEILQDADGVDVLGSILAVLRAQTRYDFRGYRQNMVLRRMRRRMGLRRIESPGEYVEFLRDNPAEVTALHKDLLINVTGFFREPEVFRALEDLVLPGLLSRRVETDPVRVWVPGCATGEEAYSIAMLLAESFAARGKAPHMQIFATDIDEDSLAVARSGIYPESIAHDLSPVRLHRYFVKEDKHYAVTRELRESVVFAPQNVVGDAPFSRIDLVSCRNLLIYFELEIQQRILSHFHFALNKDGYLVLGAYESLGRLTDLYEPVSKKWRIFRPIGARRRDTAIPTLTRLTPGPVARPVPEARDVGRTGFREILRSALLGSLEVAAVLINRGHEIVSYQGPTGDFLDFPHGKPTQDLFGLLRPGLRSRVREALQKSLRDGATVVDPAAHVRRKGGYFPCRITVSPVRGKEGEGLILIAFQDAAGGATSTTEPVKTPPLVSQLENELRTTRETLQATIEDLESSNEALKAANEEIMSMNEELQSANEELETSKEELQSLNEEMSTVNIQLQDKVDELDSAYSSLNHLLTSTEIPTLFLDREMRVRRFTASTAKLFSLVPSDLGRPIGDFALRARDDKLLEDARKVLETLVRVEREVTTDDQHHYLRRILPYRGAGARIEGVVVTFMDVTERMRSAGTTQLMAALIRDSNDAVSLLDPEGKIMVWNRGAEMLYGYTEAEALGMDIRNLVPPGDPLAVLQLMEESTGRMTISMECRRLTKDGRILDVWATAARLTDSDGPPVGVAITERDITARKREERELEDRVARRTAALGLVRDIAVQANAGQSVKRVLESCLRRICEFSDWPFGHAYLSFEEGSGLAKPAGAWHAKPLGEYEPLRKALMEADGCKLVRRAVESGNIQWTQKLEQDFGRAVAEAAEALHIRSALAFPIINEERVIAILEFFFETNQTPGPRGLEVMGSVGSLIANVMERERLKRLLVETTTYEQDRLARDLHDAVGQQLAGLTMSAESIYRKLSNKGFPDLEDLNMVVTGLRETLEEVRGLARGMSEVPVGPGVLAGLLKQLGHHVQTVTHAQIACAVDVDELVDIQDPNAATHLYRIAQEAIHNALAHSQGKNLHLQLYREEERVVLEIGDDGIGLSPTATRGMGLRIMNQRARMIGAELEIRVERGTLITCTFPKKDEKP